MIELSIIIINYNTAKLTCSAIASIRKNTPETIRYEIIVVDNASEKEDFDALVSELKNEKTDAVSIYRSKINTGFSGGNMFGYQFAKCKDFVAFLNSDILFTEDCFTPLLHYLGKTENCGIISPQSWNGEGRFVPTFDHFATWQRELLKRKGLEILSPEKHPKRRKIYNSPLKVPTVSGSFMLIRKKAFDQIGGFDTNVFLYYEETDLSLRMKKLGFDTVLFPAANYTHLHGASTHRNMQIKLEQKISLLYMIRKHQGWLPYQFLRFYLSVRYLFTALLKPRYWNLWYVILIGAPLSKSMKLKQKIVDWFP